MGVVKAALLLELASGADAFPHLGRRRSTILAAKFFVRHGRHLDVQIDPIKQRAAQLAEIALDHRAGAATFL